jgi:hypothetical protein
MTAYGAAVWLRTPKGLTVTRLAGTGSLSGWTCTVRKLRCQGSLAGGLSGRITIGGAVNGRSAAHAISVHAVVTHTNQPRRGIRPAVVPVRVFAVAARGALPGGGPHSSLTSSAEKFGLIIAGLLVTVGILLAVVTRRRPRAASAHAAQTPAYPAAPAAQDSAVLATQDSAAPATQDPVGAAKQDPAGSGAKDPAVHSAQD